MELDLPLDRWSHVDRSLLEPFFRATELRFALVYSRCMRKLGTDPREAFKVAQRAIDARPFVCDVCEECDEDQTHMQSETDYQRVCSSCKPKFVAAGYAPVQP